MTNVRVMREQRAWSQEQLAEFSGLSIRTIQRIEKEEVTRIISVRKATKNEERNYFEQIA